MLIEAARAETARMRIALGQLESDGKVVLQRDQFAKLATLIELLATRPCCDDPECFGARAEGLRWWIPLPEVERMQAELAALRDDAHFSNIAGHMRRALY